MYTPDREGVSCGGCGLTMGHDQWFEIEMDQYADWKKDQGEQETSDPPG